MRTVPRAALFAGAASVILEERPQGGSAPGRQRRPRPHQRRFSRWWCVPLPVWAPRIRCRAQRGNAKARTARAISPSAPAGQRGGHPAPLCTPGPFSGGRSAWTTGCRDIGRPVAEQVAAAFEQVRARVGRRGPVAHDVRQRRVDDLARIGLGFSLWASRMAESIRSPARLSSFTSTRSRVRVAVWRLDWRWGPLAWPWSAFRGAAGVQQTVPEFVGRRAEAVFRAYRPAGGNRGVQEGRRGATARQLPGFSARRSRDRLVPFG